MSALPTIRSQPAVRVVLSESEELHVSVSVARPGAFRPRARWVKPLKFRCSIRPEENPMVTTIEFSKLVNFQRMSFFFKKTRQFCYNVWFVHKFWEGKIYPGFLATYQIPPLKFEDPAIHQPEFDGMSHSLCFFVESFEESLEKGRVEFIEHYTPQ